MIKHSLDDAIAYAKSVTVPRSVALTQKCKNNCPLCGDALETRHYEATFAHDEADVTYCENCCYEGEPE